MPKLIPVHTVILHRDGKQVVPPLGQPFDFTKEEIADIDRLLPGAVREPVVEVATVVATVVASDAGDEKPAAKPAAKGGKSSGKDADL